MPPERQRDQQQKQGNNSKKLPLAFLRSTCSSLILLKRVHYCKGRATVIFAHISGSKMRRSQYMFQLNVEFDLVLKIPPMHLASYNKKTNCNKVHFSDSNHTFAHTFKMQQFFLKKILDKAKSNDPKAREDCMLKWKFPSCTWKIQASVSPGCQMHMAKDYSNIYYLGILYIDQSLTLHRRGKKL